MNSELPEYFIKMLNSIEAKRPKTVIQHILKHGFITNEELKNIYGYNHPPRAIRDVRELGIPIITYRVIDSTGRSIAAYKFGNLTDLKCVVTKTKGRSALSHKMKQQLIEKYGSKCFIYLENVDESSLQVDHRIPYEIGGEQNTNDISHFMLLSASANRAKSWTCEHCKNWIKKNIDICKHCFWAFPEDYNHVAGKMEKVIPVVFTGDAIADYDALQKLYGTMENMQQKIRIMIHNHVQDVD